MSTVYLTIDDAPSAALESKVDYLADAGVPALFFCEGRKLSERPESARYALEAGYHLGNHAYSHSHASEMAVADFREECRRTERLIDEVYADAGVERPATVFRFPYGDAGGEQAAALQDVLADFGFRPPAIDVAGKAAADVAAVDGDFRPGDRQWAWTLHVEDWNLETPGAIRERVDEYADRLGGDDPELLLFHDEDTTLAQFEALVDGCRDHGATFGDPLEIID